MKKLKHKKKHQLKKNLYKNDIAVAIDALREELSDDYVARIEAAVSDVPGAFGFLIFGFKNFI